MMGSQDEEVERNDLKECGGRDRQGGGGTGLGRRERALEKRRGKLTTERGRALQIATWITSPGPCVRPFSRLALAAHVAVFLCLFQGRLCRLRSVATTSSHLSPVNPPSLAVSF